MLWKSKRKFTRKLQKRKSKLTQQPRNAAAAATSEKTTRRTSASASATARKHRTRGCCIWMDRGHGLWPTGQGPPHLTQPATYESVYICIYIYAHIRYTMYSTCSVLYYSHMGRSWWVLDFIFSCASSSRIWPPFYLSLGQFYSFGFLNQWSLQKGCAFFPSQDGQVWAGKNKGKKLLSAKLIAKIPWHSVLLGTQWLNIA